MPRPHRISGGGGEEGVSNQAYGDATEATVFGPFFVQGSREIRLGGDIAAGVSGQPALGRGHRHRRGRQAGASCRIEVWEPATASSTSLIMDFDSQPPNTPTPEGRDLAGRPWSRVRFDIVLAPGGVAN